MLCVVVIRSGEEVPTVMDGTSLLVLLVTLIRGFAGGSLFSDEMLLLLIRTLIVTLPDRPVME